MQRDGLGDLAGKGGAGIVGDGGRVPAAGDKAHLEGTAAFVDVDFPLGVENHDAVLGIKRFRFPVKAGWIFRKDIVSINQGGYDIGDVPVARIQVCPLTVMIPLC